MFHGQYLHWSNNSFLILKKIVKVYIEFVTNLCKRLRQHETMRWYNVKLTGGTLTLMLSCSATEFSRPGAAEPKSGQVFDFGAQGANKNRSL